MFQNPHPFSRSFEDASVLNMDPNATKGLFVGDLSSFTTENDLHQLFGTFGSILSVEIKRGRHGDSLLHGFVEYASEASAFSAMQVMHNRKYKGRKMRVNWTNMKVPQTKNVDQWTLVQVNFSCKNIAMKITEEFLEAVFGAYGGVEDVIVKRHIVDTNPPLLHGYGNVYFSDTIPAMNAMMAMKDVSVNGVSFDCSLTMPKSASFAVSSTTSNSAHSFGSNRGRAALNSSPQTKYHNNAPQYYGGNSSRARIQSLDCTSVNQIHQPLCKHPAPNVAQHVSFDATQNRAVTRISTNYVQSTSPFANEMSHFASKPPQLSMHLPFKDNVLTDHNGKRPPLPPSHFVTGPAAEDCWNSTINNSISKSSSNSPSNYRFLNGYGSSNCSVNTATTHDHVSINSSVSKSLSRSHSGDDGSFDATPFPTSHGNVVGGFHETVRKVTPTSASFQTVNNDLMNFLYHPQPQSFSSCELIINTNMQQCGHQSFSGVDRHLFDLSPSPEPFVFNC